MFAVKPIGDKELQKNVCQSLGTDFIESDLAYFAAELTEDRASVAALIGVCQFSTGKNAVIETLVPADGFEGDEAMIVMCRAVMNFLWRCGSETVALPDSAGPASLLKACGLKECKGGYCADLNRFYASPCHYDPEADSNKDR